MLLRPLLTRLDPSICIESVPNLEILGIQEDSRKVNPGDLFIARAGTNTDGVRFIGEAAARGAVAVVTACRIEGCPIPQVIVPDTAHACSVLAHLYYGEPSTKLKVIGITGTNGKTTITYLLREILQKINIRCGMIGTVQAYDGIDAFESDMTTPGAIDVANLLARMRNNDCGAVAMEVSSHALDQQRVAGVRFAAAGFTNLTGDHMDYHKTMSRYAAAKARLFETLDEDAVAVINADSTWSVRLMRDCRARQIRFGFNVDADYRARDIAITPQSTNFVLKTPDGETVVSTPLIGRHNIENILCAAGLAGEVFGASVHQIASALKDAKGAPGRLEPVRCGQKFAVLVDYAHTDDAMENVLKTLKQITKGQLRVLFGCGGDRDPTKRPRMARAATRFADAVYITSDNPRTENPQAIIDEILTGIPADSGKHVVVEADRRTAIERILNDADDADVVLLAGKGHENYQLVGKTKHHFDDREEARRVLAGVTAK